MNMTMFQVASFLLYILGCIQAQTTTFGNYSNDYDQHQKEQKQFQFFLDKLTYTCTCENLPYKFTQIDVDIVKNSGMEVMAYFERDCLQEKWKPIYLKRLLSKSLKEAELGKVQNSHTLLEMMTIRSFGPNPNSEIFKKRCINDPNTIIMQLEKLETRNEITKPFTCLQDSTVSAINDHQEIHFFGQPHFQDFISSNKITYNCTNIFPNSENYHLIGDIQSIKTTECVMLFSENNCLGRSTQIQSPGAEKLKTNWESTLTGLDTLSLLYTSFPYWTWTTKSFYACSNHDINNGLVEITQFHNNLNAPLLKHQKLKTYENFCNCKNIPKEIRNLEQWSINNYDTSIFAYFEPDCKSYRFSPLWIPPGQSSYSTALGSFHKKDKLTKNVHRILSIGPDCDSCFFKTNCIKLNYIITKFDMDQVNKTERHKEMNASQKIFVNDSPKEYIQIIGATETFKESATIDIGISSNSMQKVELENSFEMENKQQTNQSKTMSDKNGLDAGISGKISGPWKWLGIELGGSISGSYTDEDSSSSFTYNQAISKDGLKRAFQHGSKKGSSKNFHKVLETTRTVSDSKVITVPACSVLFVHAYVITIDSFVQYRTLVKINGTIGTRWMTANEILERRDTPDDGIKYAEIYDKYTLLAYTTTNIVQTEYGQTPYFIVKSERITDCEKKNNLTNKSTLTKPHPLFFLLIVVHPLLHLMFRI